MSTVNKQCASFAAVLFLATSHVFAYGSFNARLDCLSKIVHWGSDYSNPQEVKAEETGRHAFSVSGKVNDRDGNRRNFECRIENKEVVSWNVFHESDKKSKTNKMLAIGAGVVGLAALAAVIANSKSGDQTHDDNRSTYGSGKSNPFDDMRFLRSECRRVIRQHLIHDHGAIEDLDLIQTNLNNRTLSGDGTVVFELGGVRNLTYVCHFDRGGNIYDGNYSYRSIR